MNDSPKETKENKEQEFWVRKLLEIHEKLCFFEMRQIIKKYKYAQRRKAKS